MNAAKLGPAALVGLVLGSPCAAHHGVAPHYDVNKPVRLEGVVEKFDFINPHAFVYVATVDEDGAREVWQCEMASRTVLVRNGLDADTFEPGDPITVEGVAGRINPHGCALRVAHLADGSVLRANELFGPTSKTPVAIPADPSSIEGVWTMKRFSVSRYEGQLTPVGEQARAAFDPVKDDPVIYCNTASPVRFWINVNEPFEIRREADRVVVDHQFMDAERVFRLDETAPPAGVAPSPMGYSTGRFEGKTLLGSTTRFSAGTLEPRYGIMHSQNLKLTERLEVDEAGELEITWIIDDPEFFLEPVTQTEVYVRSAKERLPYDCQPGYQQ